ncbi:MAG: phosphatidate cytidylyltransferase, partial [Eubacteriales bacterium]|nr:phosphatidate cytidylyltransferase [Eubacteriales bacterium]
MLQRVITGAFLIAFVVGVLYLGGWYFAVAACIAIAVCLYEELHALETGGHRPVHWTSYVALALSVPLMIYYSSLSIIPVLTIMSFCALLQIMRREKPELTDVMASVLPMLTLVLPGMCFFGVLDAESRGLQALLLSLVFAVAVGGDTFALFTGKAIGGRKLCPVISPNKTVAGCIGGLLGSVLCAALVWLGFRSALPMHELPELWTVLVVGAIGGAAGQIGDLFASMIKRYCGIKDFGHIFPGHGGMLDRMDSILFTAI